MERCMGTNVFWKDHLLVGLHIELDEPLGLGCLRPWDLIYLVVRIYTLLNLIVTLFCASSRECCMV